ncbi:MAG: DUF378 domain-containing protein [Chlamydiia bacterium]
MLKFVKWVFTCALILGGLSLGLSGIIEDYNLLGLIFGEGMVYRLVLLIIGISAVGEILFWFLTARPWSCCGSDGKKH